MHEQEVEIQSGEVVLKGTLCAPDSVGQFPAVLMVHGSGALDRNENRKGQSLNIFNAIAHKLADCGIASLRYDKRGCGQSSGDFMTTGHFDLVEDAVSCLDALAASGVVLENKLYILGHSEGCLIAPQVSKRRASVAGLVLLCPLIERFESVLTRQAAQLEKEIASLSGASGFFYRALFKVVGSISTKQQQLIKKVRSTDSSVVRVGLAKQPAKWFRDMLELDTESIFSLTQTPMLLIGGEKDMQCNPEDIFRIAKMTQGESETLLVDGMTHLLRVDKDNPASLMGSARLLGLPVDSVVMEKTAQWILGETSEK